jgi:hypothetical protein
LRARSDFAFGVMNAGPMVGSFRLRSSTHADALPSPGLSLDDMATNWPSGVDAWHPTHADPICDGLSTSCTVSSPIWNPLSCGSPAPVVIQ